MLSYEKILLTLKPSTIFDITDNLIGVSFEYDEYMVTINEPVNETENTKLSTVHQDIIAELGRKL